MNEFDCISVSSIDLVTELSSIWFQLGRRIVKTVWFRFHLRVVFGIIDLMRIWLGFHFDDWFGNQTLICLSLCISVRGSLTVSDSVSFTGFSLNNWLCINLIVFQVFRLIWWPKESVGESSMLSDSIRPRYFCDWLSFVWIWMRFRFSVWFEIQTLIRLFPNRLDNREHSLFLFRSQLVFYS